MQTTMKIVDFHQYCPLCIHSEVKETDMPCDECLEYPVNESSRKPIYFKEREE